MSDDVSTPVPYVFDLRFPWDERECMRAERAAVRLRDGYRAVLGITGGAGVLLLLVSVAEVVGDGITGWALLSVLPFAAVGLIGPWFVWRGLPDLLAVRNRKPARWSPGQRFAVSEDDLVVELPGEAALVPWPAIERVVETDEFLFFVGRERRPVYVPKRAFGDAAQLQALRLFVRAHVSPAAKLDWPAGPGGPACLPGADGGTSDASASGGAPVVAPD